MVQGSRKISQSRFLEVMCVSQSGFFHKAVSESYFFFFLSFQL